MNFRLDSRRVQIALKTSYYDTVSDNGPVGLWMLNEQLAATGARDLGSSGVDGVYTGGVTFGNRGPFPHGGTAVTLNGSTGHIDMGDAASLEVENAVGGFAALIIAKWTQSTTGVFMGKSVGGPGWTLYTGSGDIAFHAVTAASAQVFVATAIGSYNDGQYHTIMVSWDGTTSANGVKMCIDGTLVAQATASTTGIGGQTARFIIGANDGGAGAEINHLAATIAGVAIWNSAVVISAAPFFHATTQWTTFDDRDVLIGSRLRYGTTGKGPMDRLANAGELTLILNNSTQNSAGLEGYYSPQHDSCRAFFEYGCPIRVLMQYDGVEQQRFWGRIEAIDPDFGRFGPRKTRVTVYDYMYHLVDIDFREVTPQLGQTETDLLKTVFDALPPDVQPMALDFDATVDTYLYVFDDLRGGVKAATALNKVTLSAWARLYVWGDGTVVYRNREASTNQVIAHELDNDMTDVRCPTDRIDQFDRVRVVTHPKVIDAAATTVLFEHPFANTFGQAPFVPAVGGTLEIWGTYRNPNNDLMTVGGTSMVTPVSGTDFAAFQNADGTGSNLTASVTVVATYFASTVKLVLTNNHGSLPAYFTILQCRGKGIYDLAPVTSEAVGSPGTRPITVDLPYQADGQAIADLILTEREVITDFVHEVSLIPHVSDDQMRLAAFAELGTLITVTESQIGLDEAQAAIREIAIEFGEGLLMNVTLGLIPLVIGYEWLLDDPDFSQLGDTTVIGD